MILTTEDKLRFETPLYTIADAARIVDVPASTLATWAKGYLRRFDGRPDVTGEAVITCIEPRQARDPSIPFVGLAEALVLAAVRRSGVPMQRIRPALAVLEREIGVAHALAAQKLYSDGAELLFDYGTSQGGTDAGRVALELVVVRSGQRVFADAIDSYLQKIEYASDGYAARIHLPAYEIADVIADPARGFGAPIFDHGGAKVGDVLDRFWGGESLDEVSEEFGVPPADLEDVVRVASRRAA